MVCNASLLRSISSLNAPHREYSGGISVCLIQLPLANRKKSSPGFTDESLLLASSGWGFCSVCSCGAAKAATNEQTIEVIIVINDFISGDQKFCELLTQIRPCRCNYVEARPRIRVAHAFRVFVSASSRNNLPIEF